MRGEAISYCDDFNPCSRALAVFCYLLVQPLVQCSRTLTRGGVSGVFKRQEWGLCGRGSFVTIFPPFFYRMSLRWGLQRCLMSLQRPHLLLLRQHQLWAKAQKAATAARRAPPTQTAQTQKKSERRGWQSSRSRLLEWPSSVCVPVQ